jgi:hypothetical protein
MLLRLYKLYKCMLFNATVRTHVDMLWFAQRSENRLRLCYSKPDEFCDFRKAVAAELSATPDDGLDDMTRKIKHHFGDQLMHSAQTGFIHCDLHQLLDDIFEMFMTDTQEVEGINSIIKKITDIAPAIKLALLSDRVVIKKSLADVIKDGERYTRLERRRCAIQHAVATHKTAVDVPGPHVILKFERLFFAYYSGVPLLND